MPFFGSREMGSAVHARSLSEAGARVKAMLSLEMIGYFSDAPGSQKLPFAALGLLYPRRGNFIAVVGRLSQPGLVRRVKRSMMSATDLPVRSINAPSLIPGVDLSDHASYWREGYPAVMVTDTAFYRNDWYHTERDTPDTLDYARMAEVVAGVRRAVVDLAR
jgi:Zn-dependent M28 family amino/carboxypeptidase